MKKSKETLELFIPGTPYARTKSKGRLGAPKAWTQTVIEQTSHLPQIPGACELDVVFILPADKFPSDLPFGMDLDNLLKRLMDALGQTVLRDAPGRDSAVMALHARKRRAQPGETPGAAISFRPLASVTV
jgi:Holliday junction resolvase RusA-like endonuclease